ncbi:MAG: S-layer homology domain-containing protein, partial [Erysipelotrichaceae bacterium]|nr:S-layer homology domain-containing protein [Erysipelotrichaceae bacterium]
MDVIDSSGNLLSNGYQIEWYNRGDIVAYGRKLSGYQKEEVYYYQVVLEEELAKQYYEPVRKAVGVVEDGTVLTCQLAEIPIISVQGKVLAVDGTPIAGAAVEFKQSFAGSVVETVSCSTDSEGIYNTSLRAVETSMAVSADNYVSAKVDSLDSLLTAEGSAVLKDIILRSLPTYKITLSLSEQLASVDGVSGSVQGITDFSDLDFTVTRSGETDPLDGVIVQYPYLILPEGVVQAGEKLDISIVSKNNRLVFEKGSLTLDEELCGTYSATGISNGYFAADNLEACVMVFDGTGNYVSTYNAKGSFTSDRMPEGTYTLILFKENDYVHRMATLEAFCALNLREGTDYQLTSITIKQGIITELKTGTIPEMDVSRLSYTVDHETDFSASRTSVNIGSLVTLKASYQIDETYQTGSETLIINLPQSVHPVEGSVTLDSKIHAYTYDEASGTVQINVNSSSGTVRCVVSPTAAGDWDVDACLRLTMGGSELTQLLGTLTIDADDLSYDMPAKTGQKSVTLSGKGVSDSIITIYDNGTKAGETKTNRGGSWTATIELSGNDTDYAEHDIYVVLSSEKYGYEVTSDTRTLIFDPTYVSLAKITMINTAHPTGSLVPVEFVSVFDFINQSNEKISYNYWPKYPTFTFKVEFTRNDPTQVSNVIVITRASNGSETKVPCEFNSQLNCWVGTYDYPSSFTKPAEVTAVYDCEPMQTDEIPAEILAYAEDIEGVLSRSYYSDRDHYLVPGIFGLGWTADFESRADQISDEEGNFIVISTISGYEIFEEQDGVYRDIITGKDFAEYKDGQITVMYADGSVHKYNKNGRPQEFSEPGGDQLTFIYDGDDLTKITSNHDISMEFTYTDGKVSTASYKGHTASYTYEGDYLASVTTENGTEYYSYYTDRRNLSAGALASVRTADGSELNLDYDSFGRLISSDQDGRNTSYDYPSYNTVAVTDPSGEVTTYQYDGGQLKSVNTGSDQESLIEYAYNESGFVSAVNVGDTTAVRYAYDERSNLSEVIHADGNKVQYSYAENDQLASVTDEIGNTTSYQYSDDGNVTGITYADGTSEKYTYSSDGAITQRTLRDGGKINISYGSDDLPAEFSYADGSKTRYTYDDAGNVTSIEEDGELTSIKYDSNGNVTAIVYPDGKTIAYVYDGKNRLSSVTDSAGFTTKYIYDETTGLLRRMTDGEGNILAEYERDANGLITRQINGNGTSTVYTYDNGNVNSITLYQADGTVISSEKYTFDQMGNVSKKETLDGTWNYEYDARNQLTKSTAPDGTVTSYIYDAAGNRTEVKINGSSTEYTTGSMNRYTQVGDNPVKWDQNGSLTEFGGQTYSYDTRGRLKSYSDGTNIYEYTYDAFGNRNSITVNGEKTEYVYSPVNGGQVLTSYRDNEASSYFRGSGLTGQKNGTETYYYNFNLLGSTTDITDSSGAVVNHYTYGDYGVSSRTEGIRTPFTYAGQYGIQDEQNNLYYIHARYMNAELGRFISMDLTGTRYDINAYRYGLNNPVSYVDINGEFALTACLVVIGASVAIEVGGELLSDVAETSINYRKTGKWEWTGTWGGYAGAAAKGVFVGAVTYATGGTGIIAGAAGGGIKSVVSNLIDKGRIDLQDLAISSVIGGIFGAKPVKNFFKITEVPFLNKGAWSFDAAYKRMITNIVKHGWKYSLKTLVQTTLNRTISKWITENLTRWVKSQLKGLMKDPKGYIDNLKKFFMKVYGIDDPSGYIYEAVPSNRLEGVTATAYTIESWTDDYGNEQQETVIWNAEEYDQINPLITDKYGQYAWDVPEGQWMVAYEKENYEKAQSEWLPVPPPQTDINIGMISYEAPMVELAAASPEGVTITFSKYMIPSTVTAEAVTVTSGGKTIEGTVVPLNAEENPDSGNIFASAYQFIPADNAKLDIGEAVVSIGNTVQSYAGTAMAEAFTESVDVKIAVDELVADEGIRLMTGGSAAIAVTVLPSQVGEGRTLTVTSLTPSLVETATPIISTNAEGIAFLTVYGLLPGQGILLVKDEMSGTEMELTVMVENQAAENPDAEAAAAVEALIRAIGTVTLDSLDAIQTARAAYEALTDAQKALVSAEMLAVLEAAEARYEELLNGQDQPFEAIFTDVKDESRFYYQPVYWAYNHKPQITKGTSETLFSPDANVSRAQMVTFLWRLAGEPEPEGEAKFNDVNADRYFAKAIAWAAENEITTGYADGSGNFGPDDNCTREQIVTFLWRYAKKPAAEKTAEFTDTRANAYYLDALSWAAEN